MVTVFIGRRFGISSPCISAFPGFERVHGGIERLDASTAGAHPAGLADFSQRCFKFFGRLRDGHVRQVYGRTLIVGFRLVKPPQFRQDGEMCGRYRLTNAERYADLNDVRLGGQDILARFNIAPTQTVFVVLDESPKEFSPVK